MRLAHTNEPMITLYPTCRTADNRNLRSEMLSLTQVAGHCLQKLGMILRVDGTGSLRLLNGWLFNDDTTQVVDDSPYAGAMGIAAFKDNPVIGEGSRSWSHSIRRRKGLIQT